MPRLARLVVAIALLAIVRPAGAITVDGRLDPEYGAALSTQTTQSSLPDDAYYASELDQAFGVVADGKLYLLFAGYYNRFYSEPLILANQLAVFIDVGPGGQNTLSDANPAAGYSNTLRAMSGLKFDSDFTADYWFSGSREGGGMPFAAFYAELPEGGEGNGYFLGWSNVGAPGTLSGYGSSNPYGILGTVDLSYVDGVTAGCGASSGAGVITGIEFAIPLAAIGNPAGPIKVSSMIVRPYYPVAPVSNQVLGPVPPGTCDLGDANTVDLSTIPGDQFFTIDVPNLTPTLRSSWGRIKATYK